MTKEEILNTPELIDFMLDKNVMADSRTKVRKRLEELCELAISALEQESRWIPCSERLPKTAGVYRVTRYYPNNVMNPNYLVDACYFDGSDTWYNDNRINHERAYVNNIIAWQEDPEPYKVIK